MPKNQRLFLSLSGPRCCVRGCSAMRVMVPDFKAETRAESKESPGACGQTPPWRPPSGAGGSGCPGGAVPRSPSLADGVFWSRGRSGRPWEQQTAVRQVGVCEGDGAHREEPFPPVTGPGAPSRETPALACGDAGASVPGLGGGAGAGAGAGALAQGPTGLAPPQSSPVSLGVRSPPRAAALTPRGRVPLSHPSGQPGLQWCPVFLEMPLPAPWGPAPRAGPGEGGSQPRSRWPWAAGSRPLPSSSALASSGEGEGGRPGTDNRDLLSAASGRELLPSPCPPLGPVRRCSAGPRGRASVSTLCVLSGQPRRPGRLQRL